MESIDSKCDTLRAQIAATESQLAALRLELEATEKLRGVSDLSTTKNVQPGNEQQSPCPRKWPLSLEEYKRYGRQMIVPQIGLQGQLKLRSSSVLLVGAGGLGCPAALYLAGAGVGTLGMVDGDTVESSNLHRQVLHRTQNVGKYKVDSAIQYLKELNPHTKYIPYYEHLNNQNAPEIFRDYDIVLDCTDNPATRYLISDTAVLLGKPLVSASALRTEGQLMVLNNPPKPPGDSSGGPCYRCIFPRPPPADTVISCADGGILGPVVGTMGVLQALETIKVLTKTRDQDSNGCSSQPSNTDDRPALHIFSAYSSPPFRTIRLRRRRTDCAVCSSNPTVTLATLKSALTDYVQFCGSGSAVQILNPDERVSAMDFQPIQQAQNPYTLVDVRDSVQFGICNLQNSINIPIDQILHGKPGNGTDSVKHIQSLLSAETQSSDRHDPIYLICRLGNDSQLAVRKLKELGLDQDGKRFIGDIRGGFRAWKADVDSEWPEY